MLCGHKHPLGAIGLLPNTVALVRDGSRTRDRQICSLMLYPLSYSGRCYAEPAPFHRGCRGTQNANREPRGHCAAGTHTDRSHRHRAYVRTIGSRGHMPPAVLKLLCAIMCKRSISRLEQSLAYELRGTVRCLFGCAISENASVQNEESPAFHCGENDRQDLLASQLASTFGTDQRIRDFRYRRPRSQGCAACPPR